MSRPTPWWSWRRRARIGWHWPPCAQAGFAVAVINPDQAHSFAKALLQRAKPDAIDARTLARLAATLQPTPWTPPTIYAELQQLSWSKTLAGHSTLVRRPRSVWLTCRVASYARIVDGRILPLSGQCETYPKATVWKPRMHAYAL